MKYLEKVRTLKEQFNTFELIYVPREQNSRADLLSKLSSTKKPGNNRTVIQETIPKPSTEIPDVLMVIEEEDWRASIIQYLRSEILPPERDEANRLKKTAVHYILVGDKLFFAMCKRDGITTYHERNT
jgi:hypothetical protein